MNVTIALTVIANTTHPHGMPTYSWSDTLSGISANPPKGSKLALVILTELSSILYSGTVFGWAPILLVLRDEGLFAEICEGEDSVWCDARKEKLVGRCAACVR